MRMLVQIKLPPEPFNAYVKDGSAGKRIKKILDDAKPEAAYFTEYWGMRGLIMIVDLPDPSAVPKFAEPWFLTFCAKVEFHVVMSPDALEKAGLEELGKKWA
jgi:hypothetical protein